MYPLAVAFGQQRQVALRCSEGQHAARMAGRANQADEGGEGAEIGRRAQSDTVYSRSLVRKERGEDGDGGGHSGGRESPWAGGGG
mmetsp:Transcript_18305/g.42111  ORF Transcript_18305/g.42111 Transcript_18305/m.42111 type:complete len:85 (+) Transcript_18305:1436-1690(+)